MMIKTFKTIVAATALALLSVPAFAQVSVPTQPAAGPTPIPETENGGLSLYAYDPVAGTSLYVYLGLTLNQILPSDLNQQSLNFGTLPGWSTAFASGTSNVRWMVVAGDSIGEGGGPDFGGAFYDTLRLAVTSLSAPNQSNIGLAQALQNLNNFIALNVNGPAGGLGGNPLVALNNASPFYTGLLQGNLNAAIGGAAALSFNTLGGIADALNFYLLSGAGDGDATNATRTTYAGTWTLSSAGQLLWNAAGGPQVPLPAAVWLLLSGLMGTFAVGRRRTEQMAAA